MKTASTSIEIALSKICGENDIITPISPVDEKKRQLNGSIGPQNYLTPFSQYGLRDWAKRLLRNEIKRTYYNHITAKEVKSAIGDEMWESYYKFCFERNPWDKIISHYYWYYKTEPRPSILEYLESHLPVMLQKYGIHSYTIDGKVAVDKVYPFENLTESLNQIRSHLNLTEELTLLRTKTGTRKDKRPYQEILSIEEKEKIAEIFSEEISLFDYQF